MRGKVSHKGLRRHQDMMIRRWQSKLWALRQHANFSLSQLYTQKACEMYV